MKCYMIIAAAATANALLGGALGGGAGSTGGLLGGLGGLSTLLGYDASTPPGVFLPEDCDDCVPTDSPTEDSINVWHPPHSVSMDGCDDNEEHDWHWVHPGPNAAYTTGAPQHTWGTSTITATHVKTITRCATTVTDCPAKSTHTTFTVEETTTICPIAVTATTLATVHTSKSVVPAAPTSTEAVETLCPSETAPAAPASTTQPAATNTPPAVGTPILPPPVIAQPPAQPTGGNVTAPPAVIGAAGKVHGAGAALFAGLVAVMVL